MKKITGYRGLNREDFNKLDSGNYTLDDGQRIDRYLIGWDIDRFYFIFFEKVINFFKEKGIAYKVMELK